MQVTIKTAIHQIHINGTFNVEMDGETLEFLKELVEREKRKGKDWERASAEAFLRDAKKVR